MNIGMKIAGGTILSSVLLFAFSGHSQATSHGNNMTFSNTYGNVGNWRILHSPDHGDTCVAEQDNANFTLRIMYTEYTGDWLIGVPDYTNNSTFTGGMAINFSGAQSNRSWSDAVDFETSRVNSWAMVYAQNHIIADLKSGSSVELDTGQGSQSWSLRGSSKAITMLEQCARNKGKKPRRQIVVQSNNVNSNNNNQYNNSTQNNRTCPNFASYTAPNSSQAASVEFVDQSGNPNGALQVYWINYQGQLQDIAIFDNGKASLNTYVGHSFLVRDRFRQCYGGVYTIRPGHNQFIVR